MKKTLIFYLFNKLTPNLQNKLIIKRKTLLNYVHFNKTLDAFGAFSFIQVGANDGISFDALFDYLQRKKNIKTGIVIEPITEYFLELEKNYSDNQHIKCVNYALHPALNEVTLHKVKSTAMNELPAWSKGIASILKSHHIKLGIPENQMTVEKVKALSFKELLNTFSPNQMHYNLLQIDTEGFDAEIIKMIDFSTMKFDIIKFERVNLEKEEYKNIEAYLQENSYFLLEQPEDTIALRKGIKIFLK